MFHLGCRSQILSIFIICMRLFRVLFRLPVCDSCNKSYCKLTLLRTVSQNFNEVIILIWFYKTLHQMLYLICPISMFFTVTCYRTRFTCVVHIVVYIYRLPHTNTEKDAFLNTVNSLEN